MKRQRIASLVVFAFLSLQVLFSQVQSGGNPTSSNLKSYTEIEVVEMPYFNSVAEEQEIDANTNHVKSLKFAKSFEVYFNTKNSGNWEKNPDGSKTWRLGIKSLGAYSLNIIFSEFYLPEGAEVFVYNKAKNYVLGSFTSKNNKTSGILPISPVPGDFMMVEMRVPRYVDFEPRLVVGQVSHDYKNVFKLLKSSSTFGDSGSCNPDIACYNDPSYQQTKNAVCRMIVKGNELCSGVLVNNTLQDGTPYLLTANHCIPSEAVATKSIFYFGYESPDCSGLDGSLAHSISGSSLKATTKNLDFALVELSVKPPFEYSPYYAGWNTNLEDITSTYTIHHPQGDVKKISFDNDAPEIGNFGGGYDDSAFWHINTWEIGTTEGGSSGAPLFDQNNLVIGTLTGGTARCSSSKNDYYNMINRAWDKYSNDNNRLDIWLDPLKSKKEITEGLDPYTEYRESAVYLSNFEKNATLELNQDVSGWGYLSGHNSSGYTQYAEALDLENENDLLGIQVSVGKIEFLSEFPSVKFKVWQDDLLESNVIASKEISMNNLKQGTVNYIGFDDVAKVDGRVYYGFEINYAEVPDTFAVYNVSNVTPESYYVYSQQDGWNQIGSTETDMQNKSLAMRLLVSGNQKQVPAVEPTAIAQQTLQPDIKLYPNPGKNHIFIESSETIENIAIINIDGKYISLPAQNLDQHKVQLHTSDISPGIYFVKIQTSKGISTQRFSIVR